MTPGKGLLRNSLANHWAAAGNVETHSCYELVVPDINKGNRKSAEQARNQKAKQRALMPPALLRRLPPLLASTLC